MKSKTYLILFLFLLVLPIAFAPAPVLQTGTTSTSGIDIKVPTITYHQEYSPLNFHFHTFNVTNGVPLLNDTIGCAFHFYNKTGNHLFVDNSVKNMENHYDYEVTINGANFSYIGEYNYIIQCNGTSGSPLGGFVSSEIFVTNDGFMDDPLDSSSGISITIFILICAAMFMVLPLKVDHILKNKFADLIIKRCLFVFGIYLMMLNSAILSTISSVSNIGLENEMFRYMWIFGMVGYVFMGFIVLKTLSDIMKMWKLEKEERREGKFNG